MNVKKRIIVLDTETTGINKNGLHYIGHRIIEIGAVEIINRTITNNKFHVYIQPNRKIDLEAFKIHGISDEFLIGKPTFIEIIDEFSEFIKTSQLVIHNAPFDVGFIDYEFGLSKKSTYKLISSYEIIDSLKIARKMFPGKRNSLNALCDRFLIDRSKRSLHGALLDAEILADIFLVMTRFQISIPFETNKIYKKEQKKQTIKTKHKKIKDVNSSLKIIKPTNKELIEHEKQLNLIEKEEGICIWKKL